MGFLQNLMQAPAPGSRGAKFGAAMGNMAPLLFAMAKGLGEGKSASTYAPSGLAAMMLQQQTEADRKMRQEDRDYSRSQDARMWDWRESGRAREDAAMAREDALRRQAGDDLESVLGGFNATGVTDPARQAFDSLQIAWGSPLKVNSAYRSPEHNARVGGAKNSQHTHGNAFDVDVSGLPREERLRLIQEARRNGFRGIGVYDNALHFDVGPARAWGADYSSKSLPEWAMAAATGPINGMPVGQPSQATGQPRISPQRAAEILSNPYATDAAKQMVLAQFMPQEPEKPQIVKGADGYNYWVAPGQEPRRVVPNAQLPPEAPADEYGRYVAEETKAGRKPLSRIDYAKAKQKESSIEIGPDGSVRIREGGTAGDDGGGPLSTGGFIDAIDGALSDPALDWSVGALNWTQVLPGTPMARFKTRVDQLSGQAFMQARQALKGGGQITDFEGSRAEAAIARLSDSQGPQDYRDALTELRAILVKAMQRERGWTDTSVGKIMNMSAAEIDGLGLENMTPEEREAARERLMQIARYEE